ncbi:MAG: Fic family protein, partial [Fusobacteriaceae bacterium]
KTIKEHLELRNHRDAILYVEKILAEKISLSEEVIKNIHREVYKNIGETEKFAGNYRDHNVVIRGANFFPSKYSHLEIDMKNLVDWYNSDKSFHPVEKSAELHGKFIDIHPFADGNGRTARLLLNFELMSQGYPPIIIEREEREEYFVALNERRDGKNTFAEFILKKVFKQLDFLLEII